MNGVVTAILQFREALEVVRERDLLIAGKIMVSQRGINGYLVFAPHRGFLVPDAPVIRVRTIVGNIAANGYERGVSVRNGLHQRLAHQGIGSVGILGIGETWVAIGDETERHANLRLQVYRFGLS